MSGSILGWGFCYVGENFVWEENEEEAEMEKRGMEISFGLVWKLDHTQGTVFFF